MKPFRPPSIFSTATNNESKAVSKEEYIPQESMAQSPYFNQVQELLGSNSSSNKKRIGLRSSNRCSQMRDVEEDDNTEKTVCKSQNVLIWTRLANGDTQIILPSPQNLELLDFQQILIAKNNLEKIADNSWLQEAQKRLNYYLKHKQNLSNFEIQELNQASSVLAEAMQSIQLRNTKQIIEQTVDVLLQSFETKDYEKLGEKIYQASKCLSDSSEECIGIVLKEVLENRFESGQGQGQMSPQQGQGQWQGQMPPQQGQGSQENQEFQKREPDTKFLQDNLQKIRQEFQHFKLINCQVDRYQPFQGLCFMLEVILQKVEIGVSSQFAEEGIELILLRIISMFFGVIRGFKLTNDMIKLSLTWKDCQMKYLVTVAENPDKAYLKQTRWELAGRNLSFPRDKGESHAPGSRNARLKEVAQRNVQRENLAEKMCEMMGLDPQSG
eukprot:TRINITY_DN19688_c0_g1_i3.p1 TRINITY_DN19688_c0_g1~~TRINITY_DN19688_c0_g1_i3.p1  ORF type:complete len:440 (-),score=57.83 TRINITY_DN19688_c0_g1_i3:690-2009(-)